jgi:hypothetical protein
MLGALTDQIGRCFGELMEELRGIREELALLRMAIEDSKRHPALRPVNKKAAGGRAK